MKYNVGDVVKGVVSGITSYGVFVKIDNEFTGLIHISEISSNFVRNINDYVRLNDEILVKIIGIDEENFHLKLSIQDIDYDLGNRSLNKEESGFATLKNHLEKWIDAKKEEYGIKID